MNDFGKGRIQDITVTGHRISCECDFAWFHRRSSNFAFNSGILVLDAILIVGQSIVLERRAAFRLANDSPHLYGPEIEHRRNASRQDFICSQAFELKNQVSAATVHGARSFTLYLKAGRKGVASSARTFRKSPYVLCYRSRRQRSSFSMTLCGPSPSSQVRACRAMTPSRRKASQNAVVTARIARW